MNLRLHAALAAIVVGLSMMSVSGCLTPKLKGRNLTAATSTTASAVQIDPAGIFSSVFQMGATALGAGPGNVSVSVADSVVDSAGNIYYCGAAGGNFADTFGGVWDVMIAKHSPTGAVIWTKQLGQTTLSAPATTGDDECSSIKIGADGNIYISGVTTGNLAEANGGGGFYDAFAASFTSSGTLRWITQLGNITRAGLAGQSDTAGGIAVDTAQNAVVIAGNTNGALGEANSGTADLYLARFNATTGAFQWAKQLGAVTGVGMGLDPTGIDVTTYATNDSSGNIYVTGYTYGWLKEVGAGAGDVIAYKADFNGNFYWFRHLGNISVGANGAGDDLAYGITVNSATGEVIVTGQTEGNLGEANGGGGLPRDIFAMSFNPTSGAINWITQLGSVTMGANAFGREEGRKVTTDAMGNIYLGAQAMDSFAETNGGGGLFDMVLAKLSSSGQYKWSRQLGSVTMGANASNVDYTNGVGVDSSQNIYLMGYTYSNMADTTVGANCVSAKFTP